MRLANTYKEAHDFIRALSTTSSRDALVQSAFAMNAQKLVGIDIGKQFGTRIVMHLSAESGHKLLTELEKRDLPLPQVILHGNKVLIGADPE